MAAAKEPKAVSPARRPGTYTACPACGRLLRIEWRTRSIVCACGERLKSPGAPAEAPAKR